MSAQSETGPAIVAGPGRVAGHFGEWLQGRLGAAGPVALVTLHCPALFMSSQGEGAKSPVVFAPADLARFRGDLGIGASPWPEVSGNIPPGCGAGASTATLMALARGAGFAGAPEDLARACLAVEGASDPLMMPTPDGVLWASREARVLEVMTPPPPCDILGGYWGAPERTDPEDMAFPDISDLLPAWRAGLAARDLASLGRVASEAALRSTRARGPADPMADLAPALGALGHIRAYSGSARGLVFAPGTVPPHGAQVLTEAGLRGCFEFRTGRS